MIHKFRTPGRLTIPFPVSTTPSVERIYRSDPVNVRTKMRRTLRFPVGKGSPLLLARARPLPHTHTHPHPFLLTRRLLGFLACLAGAAVCFGVAFLTLPLLAIRPAKFALSFRYAQNSSMSSLLTFTAHRSFQPR